MYAIIVEGRVAALTEGSPPAGSMYMETFDWDVRPGWLLSGGALVAPPAPAGYDSYAAEPEYLDLGQISIAHAERLYAAAQSEAAVVGADGKAGDGPATVLLELLGL